MARYIDADKKIHIQIFDEEHEEYVVLEQTIAECLDSYTDEGCPEPVDVQGVKHAHWENEYYHSGFFHTCSCCHRETLDYGDKNFCPVCGAKMDGKQIGVNKYDE